MSGVKKRLKSARIKEKFLTLEYYSHLVNDMSELKIGDMAPDFCLPTQSGEQLSLADLKGCKTVLTILLPKGQHLGLHAGGKESA